MSKTEFLSILRGQLTGQIPTGEVASQINYYEAYIDGQIGNGMNEEQVIEELGDPRLIAKTLIDSTNRAAEEAGYDGPYRSSTDTYDDSDGINSGIFGNSAGNSGGNGYSENNGYSGSNGERYGYGPENGPADRAGAQSDGPQVSGAGCGVIIFIAVILLILIAALVFSLIRFSIRNFGSIILIGAVVAGVIVLIRYIGRR
ncbi:MAG: DUF1700 domain-containing protein [Lachnospiraceae bacterium]|nr:DUF1700 domain-containing protein [Lachnospiraceae bacterium]